VCAAVCEGAFCLSLIVTWSLREEENRPHVSFETFILLSLSRSLSLRIYEREWAKERRERIVVLLVRSHETYTVEASFELRILA
jgi:hypothetical protein